MKYLLLFATFVVFAFGRKSHLSSSLCLRSECTTWSDSCNTCTCLNGVATCTEIACSFYTKPRCTDSEKAETFAYFAKSSKHNHDNHDSHGSHDEHESPQENTETPDESSDMPQTSEMSQSGELPGTDEPQIDEFPETSNVNPRNPIDMPQTSDIHQMTEIPFSTEQGKLAPPYAEPTTGVAVETTTSYEGVVIVVGSILTLILTIITCCMCKHAFCRIKCCGGQGYRRRCNMAYNMESV